MSVTINGTSGVTFNDASTQTTAATGFGFKNRIINGAMVIDQRNAGAAVTANGAFPVDRFVALNDSDGAFSAQQDTVAPTGFVNSLKFTTTTADASLGATQYAAIQHRIEGLNVADLNWGATAASAGQTASPVTLSFWVRSSLTGTFGGVVANSAANRSYPFTYTISAANTWEQKSITIAGDTTGTWLTTNGIGIRVTFGLGAGSTFSGTAGAWAGATYVSATGATSVIGTLNATWQVTGVQLEKGSTATSFDYRPYGTELALCQRYLPAFNSTGSTQTVGVAYVSATTNANIVIPFMVQPRVVPTGITTTAASGFVLSTSGSFTLSALAFNTGSLTCGTVSATVSGATTGNGGLVYASASGSQILFTGCEL